MKRFVMCLLAASCAAPVVALDVGDPVDAALVEQLNIDPNKITVIDFFAEWCESCRKELPLVSAVHTRADSNKIAFLGVDTSDSASAGAAFQKELRASGGLTFTTLSDTQQKLVKAFKPKGYPALYILKGGKVVKAHLGAMPNIDKALTADFNALGANTNQLTDANP
jgi:cytochrome c biogenesis protein CcmG, thiol:disulfide interchange protein DsbE